jgi:uncharacterized membrane protein
MTAEINANIHTLLGIIVFGLIAKWYVWPKLKTMKLTDALVPLLLISAFRYTGLLFIYPTVTANMPEAFAVPAAWGDFVVAMIALVAAIVCRTGHKIGVILAWVYAITGSIDFMNAIRMSNQHQVANYLGGVWPLYLIGGPIFIVTLIVLFSALIRIKNEE